MVRPYSQHHKAIPPLGFEPRPQRLRAACATIDAMRASVSCYYLSKQQETCPYQYPLPGPTKSNTKRTKRSRNHKLTLNPKNRAKSNMSSRRSIIVNIIAAIYAKSMLYNANDWNRTSTDFSTWPSTMRVYQIPPRSLKQGRQRRPIQSCPVR